MEGERCEYCGASLRSAAVAARKAARNMEVASRKAWWRSWIYLAGIVGVSALMAILSHRNTRHALLRAAKPAPSGNLGSATATLAKNVPLSLLWRLTSVAQPDGKLGVLFAASGEPAHALVLLDAATGAVRWNLSPFSAYVRKEHVALLGDKLLVVDQARLMAYATHDGSMDWRASLMADVMEYGESLLVSGVRVAVLLRDGTTQVFDVNTGKTVWSHKQTPPPSHLTGAGDVLIEFQRVEKKRGYSEEIAIVEIASGEVRHRLRPHCSSHSIMPVQVPGHTSPLLLSPDGQELYLFYGDFRFCAERWNLGSGKMAWQLNHADRDERGRAEGFEVPFLLGDDLIVYPARDRGVYAFKRSTGELRKLLTDPEYNLAPAFSRGNLLVVSATPTWEHRDCGSSKNCSLFGVDIAKGAVAWRYVLPPDTRMGHRKTAERFQGRLGPESLRLAQVSGTQQLVLDRIDLDSGVSKFHQEIALPSEIRDLAYEGDMVWVGSRGFVGVDAHTGAVRYRLQ